jgi:hypothetical protein
MRDAVADFVWNVFRASDAGPAGVCLALQLLDRRLATGPPIMNFSILLRAAVACLLLGSKMEDRAPLPADDLYPLTDGGTGTLQDLLSMERDLCRVLRHDFALPTAWHFLTYYCHLTAPGSADLKASAFAALHATSLSGTYASARPQLAAAGSVAWAVCNRGLLQLDKFRKREKRPHDVDALEEPQCKTETVLSRQHRHWRTLVSACGLADTCLAKAYRAVARRVAAQCYLPPGPHVKANSFLRLWLGAKTILQPPVHEAAQRVMDACACHASNALLRQLRKPCFDAGTAVDSYTEDYGNDDQEDYDDDDD